MSLRHSLTRQLVSSVRIVFRTEMAFRMNFIFIFIGLPIKIAITWLLWDFIIGDGSAFRGLTQNQILLYVAFTSFLGYLYDIETGLSIMEHKLINGGAVVDLTLPIEFHINGIFSQWGSLILYFIAGSITMIGLILLAGISFEFSLVSLIITVVIVLLNTFLLYYLMSALAALSVLIGSVREIRGTLIQILQLLGGSIIPIAFFPKFMQGNVFLNPFSSLLDFPAMILISSFNTQVIVIRSLVLITWLVVLILFNKWLWRISRDKFSAPGE